jgi:hypothetical protein
MKHKSKRGLHRFEMKVLGHGNSYYIDRIAELEKALARKPRQLQIDLVGNGEIPADWALLIRSVLRQRAPRTELVTNARSSLQGGSVLVWLLGDRRMIRDDARVFFRRVELPDAEEADKAIPWQVHELKYADSFSETDPEDADYANVLRLANEFLPVKELAGQIITVPVLRQFGLVENEHLDRFLATAFAKTSKSDGRPPTESKSKRPRVKARAKADQSK